MIDCFCCKNKVDVSKLHIDLHLFIERKMCNICLFRSTFISLCKDMMLIKDSEINFCCGIYSSSNEDFFNVLIAISKINISVCYLYLELAFFYGVNISDDDKKTIKKILSKISDNRKTPEVPLVCCEGLH